MGFAGWKNAGDECCQHGFFLKMHTCIESIRTSRDSQNYIPKNGARNSTKQKHFQLRDKFSERAYSIGCLSLQGFKSGGEHLFKPGKKMGVSSQEYY